MLKPESTRTNSEVEDAGDEVEQKAVLSNTERKKNVVDNL